MDRHPCGWGLMRTVENRTDEKSGEICLLPKVQIVWDLWSIRVAGPRAFLRVGHDSGVYSEGVRIVTEGGIEGERFRDGAKTFELNGREWPVSYKSAGKTNRTVMHDGRWMFE